MSAEPERPSARAVERLATGVGEDVDDLRTRLHRALDEADRLQAEGRRDLAVSVLEEQRDALLVVHQRLEARLADAAVEREAERVLHGAAPAAAAEAAADPAVAAGDDGMALRLVASAVAAVLGVALLLSPETGSGELTAAGSSAASDALEGQASSAAADLREPTIPSTTGERPTGTGETSGSMDRRSRALAAADAASSRDRSADDDGTDPSDDGELVPLPDVGPTLEALTWATPEITSDEEHGDDSAGADSDDGSAAGDREAAGDEDADDDTSQDGQDEGARSSSQDADTDDDGTEDDTSADGSTSGDQMGSGDDEDAPDADGEEPASDGIDLDGTGGESMSLER